MSTAGTWYYPPCAGTGNLLLANPPFIFQSMDNNQPTTGEGLPDLTVEEFAQLSQEAGGSALFEACNYDHAFRIARAAYRLGADVELEECCAWLKDEGCRHWLENNDYDFQQGAVAMRAARRPNPPTLKEQALAQLDALHADIGAHGLGTNTDTIRRALDALPDA